MANPVMVDCTADTWVKVATAVKAGWIHRKTNKTAIYLQTYRLTGEAAPTDQSESIQLFMKEESEPINADVAIDVYVYCVGETGRVRVDV